MKENENYHQLIDYYNDCFSFVDFFHFNSDVSKMEYERVLGAVHGKTIMITHSDIKDRRRVKLFSGNGLILLNSCTKLPVKSASMIVPKPIFSFMIISMRSTVTATNVIDTP